MHVEEDFGNIQKERGDLDVSKNVADFEEERDSSAATGKEREMKNLQGRIEKLQKEI